jgi:hypothetical protein
MPDQSPYSIAIGYVGLKENDKACAELARAYQVRDINMYFLKVQPELDVMRGEPCFNALLKKVNLK